MPPNMGLWCCCGGAATNPCPAGESPMDVTISWSSAPTGNSGWELTNTGQLDMFGYSFTNGQTHEVCGTETFGNTSTGVGTAFSTTAAWVGPASGGAPGERLSFNRRRLADNFSGYANAAEGVATRDGAERAIAGVVFLVGGTTYTSSPSWLTDNSTSISTVIGLSTTELAADFNAPFNFDDFGGQITTTDGITIVWAKSAFISSGNAPQGR